MPVTSQNGFALPLVLLFVVIFLAGSAGVGYFLGQKKSFISIPPAPPETAPITQTTPNPTPSWTTYESKKTTDTSYSSFKISYPPNWTKKLTNFDGGVGYIFELGTNGYLIKLTQAGRGGVQCVFKGEDLPDHPFVSDLRDQDFTEIVSFNSLRYPNLSPSGQKGPHRTEFCQKGDSGFSSPTSIGTLLYEVPEDYSLNVLKEMDQIVSSIKLSP